MVGQKLSSYYTQPIRDLSLVLENSKEDENIPEIVEASGSEIIEESNIPDFHPKLLENSFLVRDPENPDRDDSNILELIETSKIDFPDFHSNFHPQLSENSSFVCVPEILETSGSKIQIMSENSKIYSDFGDVYSNFHPELSENSFVRLETPEIQNKPDIEVAIDSINNTSAEIREKVELLPGIISNIQITIEVTKSGTINVVTDVPFNFDILGNLATKHKNSEVLESLINSTISSISISSNRKLSSSSMIEIPKSNIEKLILIINEKNPKCPKILMAESQLRELFSSNELFENGVAAILSLIENEEIENSEKFENAINCIKNILKIYINLGLKSAADIAEELNNRILANYNPDVNDNCF